MIQQSLFPQKAENASFPRYPVKAPAVKNGRNSPFLLHKDKKDNSLRPTGSGADKIRYPGQYLDSHENQGRTTPGKRTGAGRATCFPPALFPKAPCMPVSVPQNRERHARRFHLQCFSPVRNWCRRRILGFQYEADPLILPGHES